MALIDFVFFFYIFIGLYLITLLIILYLGNNERVFENVKGKPEKVSIVMPCYNEGKNIGKAIEAMLNLNYPRKMLEIIIVDDKSTDNSVDVIEKYAKKYTEVRLIKMKKNFGRAAGPTNVGIRAAKHKYIAVADADSTPDREALIKMIGFLQREKEAGVVTCSIFSKRPRSFWQRMQNVEYAVIAFTRKLLDFVDSVFVAPGPLALYRRKELIEMGLFDEHNMTQDIEMTWRYLSKGYKARMCLGAFVYSETPLTFRAWWRQRIRWNVGGLQTLARYKSLVFRRGMLGLFIIPIFAVSLFLGLFGLMLFAYLFGRRFLISYLSTKYSVYANTVIFRFEELNFAPSVLNFFGASMFLLGLVFLLFTLSQMKMGMRGKVGLFNLMTYNLLYLILTPLNLLNATYKFVRGTYKW